MGRKVENNPEYDSQEDSPFHGDSMSEENLSERAGNWNEDSGYPLTPPSPPVRRRAKPDNSHETGTNNGDARRVSTRGYHKVK